MTTSIASRFYHAVGSGIFLDCVAIRQRGTILAYTNRGAENRANDNYTPDAGPGKEYGMHYEAGRCVEAPLSTTPLHPCMA